MPFAILKKDLVLASRNLSGPLNSALFFIVAISVFSLSFANLSDAILRQQISIAAIWICMILAILSGAICLREDFADGTMEQLLISSPNFSLTIAEKMFANWLIHCLPLLIATPLIALLSNLNWQLIWPLLMVAVITSLIINAVVIFGSALMLSANDGWSLLAVLTLPLLVPVIILANAAFSNYFTNTDNFYVAIKLLLAIFILLKPLLSLASAWVIRIAVE